MEPSHNNYVPPAELPNPQENGAGIIPELGGVATPELRGAQPVAGTTSQPLQVPTDIPGANPLNIQPISNSTQQGQQTSAALIADDSDLIEKEWVIKAKAIVMQTRDDPHKQNSEMSKVKADYLKKRYNKDLKLSDN